MVDSDFIVGTCETMCPLAEVQMRIKNKLVHFLEINQESSSGWTKSGNYVKEFSRSAADKKTQTAENLRTYEALQKTLHHLLNKVLLNSDRPFNVRYDFIFDRLRAVRQEIVIQNFSSSKAVTILEPIVMFLSFSLIRLSGSPIAVFDPMICTQHLQECLWKCLTCYEEMENLESVFRSNRIIVEGIYLLLNMDDTSALQRALMLDLQLKSTFIVQSAIKISINFHLKNFYKVIDCIKNMPHLLSGVAALKIPKIRKEVLKTFSIAYNSSTLSVPIEFLEKLLVYESRKILIEDLRLLGVYEGRVESPTHVIFNKKKFDDSKSISNTSYQFVENQLQDYHLPDLLFFKNL